mmetsp:Transcript_29411/g.83754  ORF Transcript_29411/g.83754 Transcript_29411/m.83754 type:complete len:217 (-) Transcript_29411:141-791(-)
MGRVRWQTDLLLERPREARPRGEALPGRRQGSDGRQRPPRHRLEHIYLPGLGAAASHRLGPPGGGVWGRPRGDDPHVGHRHHLGAHLRHDVATTALPQPHGARAQRQGRPGVPPLADARAARLRRPRGQRVERHHGQARGADRTVRRRRGFGVLPGRRHGRDVHRGRWPDVVGPRHRRTLPNFPRALQGGPRGGADGAGQQRPHVPRRDRRRERHR